MKKYAKIIDPEKGIVEVGIGDPEAFYQTTTDPETGEEKTLYVSDFYKSLGMEEMDVEEDADGQWYLAGSAPPPPEPTPQEILLGYENAVQAHLDSVAQSRDYDNTYTCLSYLNSTDETWNREAHAFNAWRDMVWRKCHEVLNAFMAGTIAQPTVEELIAQLPVIDWNDPAAETTTTEE